MASIRLMSCGDLLQADVRDVAFARSRNEVAVCDTDGGLYIWRLNNNDLIHHDVNFDATSLDYSCDDAMVQIATKRGLVEVFDSQTFHLLCQYRAHNNLITRLRSSPNKPDMIATVGGNSEFEEPKFGEVTIRDVAAQMSIRIATGANRTVAVNWSSDGQFLLTGSWDHIARIWDVHTRSEICSWEHELSVYAVTMSQDGSQCWSGDGFGTLFANVRCAETYDFVKSCELGNGITSIVEVKSILVVPAHNDLWILDKADLRILHHERLAGPCYQCRRLGDSNQLLLGNGNLLQIAEVNL